MSQGDHVGGRAPLAPPPVGCRPAQPSPARRLSPGLAHGIGPPSRWSRDEGSRSASLPRHCPGLCAVHRPGELPPSAPLSPSRTHLPPASTLGGGVRGTAVLETSHGCHGARHSP